ncbi:glycoside hydrolase family 16 protein [Aspergillus thermomutatus]|uniref:GH16 domain-containing protein n=1 Tax=Aspergillus thermomutatus TaxID=41047 RepID=A0A397GF63_ASPTH|nr:uncharacterized protein CDV56_105367 [Aspergillus thermomutatus]RHZ49652.1 hypothetical protein CDV56_105367 [Aspergillus thermomutatus]
MKAFLFYLLPSLLAAPALSHPASSNSNTVSPRLPFDFYKRQCDCYVVSGPEPGYFENYAFWDFRKIPLPRYEINGSKGRANMRSSILSRADRIDNNNEVDEEKNVDEEAEFDFGTLLLSHTAFARDWKPQRWHRKSDRTGPVSIINSPENIFFARNTLYADDSESTHLVLRTTRFPDHTATAELEHKLRNIFHCSLRVRMRVMKVDSLSREPMLYGRPLPKVNTTDQPVVPGGACAGIFTYRSSTCESDIEILTSDPHNIVRYANQPDYDPITDTMIPGAASIGTLPGPWTNPITHRVDWLHNITNWYADGEIQAFKTYQVPNQPSMIAINLWSNGGEWTGDMPVGHSVYIGIEWIELAYNTSAKVKGAPSDTVPFQGHRHRPLVQFAAVELESDNESSAEEVEFTKRKEDRECLRPCFLDS